ncbi:MAG: ABC transporter substrate-binding protein [Gammaproteobacteria bacterium HGW-Gammaproteobacteria-1]|jgi:putative ABC transport system permease protein|nr:MAG: ABC transporter substrate-binding protein [Gammaproteobacteria bacterium HGW-Gammaproteobacteria-1]
MVNVLKLATRNLLRYHRRTSLTASLITLGIIAVLMFVALSGSFKALMIGQITDSMLGHLQIHRKGYVASIDNLPLNLLMKPGAVKKIESQLEQMPQLAAWSPRIKFSAMFSNFTETTGIRLNGIDPLREAATCPLLPGRLSDGTAEGGLVQQGRLLIPDIIARGMKVKVGDTVVLVATNQDGSVNGQTFVVQGVLESATGPGGRDAYMHIDDARSLLRLEDASLSEYAVRLNDPAQLPQVMAELNASLGQMLNQQGKPALEVHDWKKLTPFTAIANMIDLLTLFIKVMLVGIVLISIMNVMVMAVYERMREIGTLAAIGTPPRRILGLFVAEGLLLGLAGTVIGTLISLGAVGLLRVYPVYFDFGRQENLQLVPSLAAGDVLFIGVLVTIIAVLASLQPAWKASRMDPITALRAV